MNRNDKSYLALIAMCGFCLCLPFIINLIVSQPVTAPTVQTIQAVSTTEAFKSPRTATSSIKVIPVVPRTKTATTTNPGTKNEALSTNQQVGNILRLVNAERTKAGLPTLKENGKLDRGAQLKAEDMDAKQYWAHYSPSGEGVGAWMRKAGYEYRTGGENLAMGFTTDEATVAGWMASPTHRANILDPDFTETGVGIKKGSFDGKETTFITQFFGEPYE